MRTRPPRTTRKTAYNAASGSDLALSLLNFVVRRSFGKTKFGKLGQQGYLYIGLFTAE